MIKTKTRKTPLLMAEAFGLMCCPSTLVPESTLSHIVEAHPGLVPKPCHHRGKTTLATLTKKPFFSVYCWFKYVRSRFSWFFLDEKDSLKGITVFVLMQYVCLHASRLITNGVNTLTSVSFSARGFKRFCIILSPEGRPINKK